MRIEHRRRVTDVLRSRERKLVDVYDLAEGWPEKSLPHTV